MQWQPEVWSQFCQKIYWRPGQKGSQENGGAEKPDESPQQQGWPHGENILWKISCENSFWNYKMIAFLFWIRFVFNLILFLFDKYSWLWSNQLPDAVHIHDICLQFHDFIKIELYVQNFKFRHSIVPTNLVHSSMRTCWEPIWLFPHVDIKSYFKSKK